MDHHIIGHLLMEPICCMIKSWKAADEENEELRLVQLRDADAAKRLMAAARDGESGVVWGILRIERANVNARTGQHQATALMYRVS